MKKQQSIIQKAKAYKSQKRSLRRFYTKDDMKLALLWLNDEVSGSQVNYAIWGDGKTTDSRFYPYIAISLREAFRNGLLKIK